MLGKLFNLGAGAVAGTPASTQSTAQRPFSSLESVQEDIHTRTLLFPDAQALYEHRHDQVYPLSSGSALPATSSTNAFDYDGDLELEARDVRIIIMQDALSSVTASLLYDSQPPPTGPASPAERSSPVLGSTHTFSFQEPRRTLANARKPSVSQGQRPVVVQSDSSQLRQGAFDQRRASIHAHNRNQSNTESDSQRVSREYREELNTFSSCIFGNSELIAYKRKSTKVHVVPEPRSQDHAVSVTTLGDGRGSVGRASMRSSRLSQSFTSENVPPFGVTSTSNHVPRHSDRKKVLITRLFPVTIPTDDDTAAATPQSRFSEDSSGYPFPAAGDDVRKKARPRPKQKKTPMYAIALVINLPQASSSAPAPRSGYRASGSFTEQETSFPSSLSSTRRSGWTMVGQFGQGGYGVDSFESAIGSDIEDRTDAITQHWDIIERTLNHLQTAVAAQIYAKLKQADLSSPDPFSVSSVGRTPSFSGRRSEDLGATMKLPKTNAKNLSLMPYCLMDNSQIAAAAESARGRIVTGLRASRVITGQDRWGIWREEARWVAKWAGSTDQESFFFRLVTGFLATHTEWLQALAPSSYRRRHYMQQRSRSDDDAVLPARTVIVAKDKMAARRLVFLLSAFLPASQNVPTLRPHRPSTAASYGTLSQSPPTFVVPVNKEESLRRRINRRNGTSIGGARRISHSRNVSLQGGHTRVPGVPATLAHLAMEGRHERRASDAASIRTGNLPFPGQYGLDAAGRKTSAMTTATITPDTSIPYFASARRGELFASDRPGSSSSTAADDLKRLTRDDSVGAQSHHSRTASRHSSSKWGDVISGFWGKRRDSVSAPHAHTIHPPRTMSSAVGSNASTSPIRSSVRKPEESPPTFSETNAESSALSDADVGPTDKAPRATVDDEPVSSRSITEDVGKMNIQPEMTLRPQRTPDPSGAYESPVKTSINLDDGVIDVDVPFPDYLTSFESAISSPSSSGFLSTPGLGSGLDAFEQSSRASMDGDQTLNVAGWLQKYHPDFVLQALPAQTDFMDQVKVKDTTQRDLIEKVKASLRAEPTPTSVYQPSEGDSTERWVHVSSALIADTTTFTVTRIRYRRLVRPRVSTERGTPIMSSSYASHYSALNTPVLSPYEVQLEEEFQEEEIASFDENLIEAVERVVSLSTDVSKGTSNASSRSTSKRRERSNSASTMSDDPRSSSTAAPSVLGLAQQEVPRAQCKTVVLSALEDVIQSVIEQSSSKEAAHAADETQDNSLRKAVRSWLEEVDHYD